MKIGDLVRSISNNAHRDYGVILVLGNRTWDGARWVFAHAQVSWSNGRLTWERGSMLEIFNTVGYA